MSRLVRACLALALASTGCASVNAGPPVVTSVPKSTEERSVATPATAAAVTQDGTTATIQLEKLCTIERVDVSERTSVRSYQNDTPRRDAWAVVGGVLLGGAGVAMVVEPTGFPQGSGDNATFSTGTVKGIGYGAIGAGALLLVIPVIDHFRAQGVAERRVERVAERGPVLRKNERCGPAPAGTEVLARFPGGRDAVLGFVDGHGRLRVDLASIVQPEWTFERKDRAVVHVGGTDRGELALEPLHARRENAAWTRLATSPCLASYASDACSGELAYIRDFPDGEHVAEAETRGNAAKARRHVADEETAWVSLDLGSCRQPSKKRGSSEVAAACLPLETFLGSFPESGHAGDVQSAVLAGRMVQARLETVEARRGALALAAPPRRPGGKRR